MLFPFVALVNLKTIILGKIDHMMANSCKGPIAEKAEKAPLRREIILSTKLSVVKFTQILNTNLSNTNIHV